MSVIIEVGKIVEFQNDMYKRTISVTDGCEQLISRTIYAVTRAELEIVDHENFQED